MSKIMPGVIAVSDFVRETREDINSPTTSGFVNRIPQCKETVVKLEEVRPGLYFSIFLSKIYVRNADLGLTGQDNHIINNVKRTLSN
jgi:hypothetical protein